MLFKKGDAFLEKACPICAGVLEIDGEVERRVPTGGDVIVPTTRLVRTHCRTNLEHSVVYDSSSRKFVNDLGAVPMTVTVLADIDAGLDELAALKARVEARLGAEYLTEAFRRALLAVQVMHSDDVDGAMSADSGKGFMAAMKAELRRMLAEH